MVLEYKARLSESREITTDILGARPGTAIVEEFAKQTTGFKSILP